MSNTVNTFDVDGVNNDLYTVTVYHLLPTSNYWFVVFFIELGTLKEFKAHFLIKHFIGHKTM